MAVELHRTVKLRLADNAKMHVDWTRKYSTNEDHQIDKDRIAHLEADARAGVGWIIDLADRKQAELVERASMLDAEEREDVEQAGLRARVDTSDEGRLMHRYAVEHERGLLKLAEAVQKRSVAAGKLAQHPQIKLVTARMADGAPPVPGPVTARNEANPGGRMDPSRPSNPAPTGHQRSRKRSKGRPDRR
jgi:hypothetical protein